MLRAHVAKMLGYVDTCPSSPWVLMFRGQSCISPGKCSQGDPPAYFLRLPSSHRTAQSHSQLCSGLAPGFGRERRQERRGAVAAAAQTADPSRSPGARRGCGVATTPGPAGSGSRAGGGEAQSRRSRRARPGAPRGGVRGARVRGRAAACAPGVCLPTNRPRRAATHSHALNKRRAQAGGSRLPYRAKAAGPERREARARAARATPSLRLLGPLRRPPRPWATQARQLASTRAIITEVP